MKTTRLMLVTGSRIEVPAGAPEPEIGNCASHSKDPTETVDFAQFAASQAARATTYTTPETPPPAQTPEEQIAAAVRRHGRVALMFSGGAESLLLLALCRPFKDAVTVFWANSGAAFPHTEKFNREVTRDFEFVEVRGDVLKSIKETGWPAKVVPASNTLAGAAFHRRLRGPMVRPWTECCLQNRTSMLGPEIERRSIACIIHGQRAEDFRLPANRPLYAPGATGNYEILTPLWRTTRREVMARIESLGLELPKQYPELPDSLECWACTADFTTKRRRWMEKHYPDLANVVAPVAAQIRAMVENEIDDD